VLLSSEGAVGIEPSVEFDAAFVALFDGEGEGVPGGAGWAAHFPGEEGGPGFEGGGVEGIASGADLEDEGIETKVSGFLDEGEELGLLLGGGKAGFGGPVDVAHGGDPGGAHLAGWGRGSREIGSGEGWGDQEWDQGKEVAHGGKFLAFRLKTLSGNKTE
jgi:hypothetical protein